MYPSSQICGLERSVEGEINPTHKTNPYNFSLKYNYDFFKCNSRWESGEWETGFIAAIVIQNDRFGSVVVISSTR